jgi:hypothetical protein
MTVLRMVGGPAGRSAPGSSPAGPAVYWACEPKWTRQRPQPLALVPKSHKIGPFMDDAKAEVCAFTGFPRSHWPKLWSTNPLKRVNKSRDAVRDQLAGAFPGDRGFIAKSLQRNGTLQRALLTQRRG